MRRKSSSPVPIWAFQGKHGPSRASPSRPESPGGTPGWAYLGWVAAEWTTPRSLLACGIHERAGCIGEWCLYVNRFHELQIADTIRQAVPL